MNRKRTILNLGFLLVCSILVINLKTTVSADSKVKLSKSNFPGLYQSLKDCKADANKDGYLSKGEIAKITSLTVNRNSNMNGLELLTSLNYLTIKNFSEKYLKVNDMSELDLTIESTGKSLTVEGMYLKSITVNSKTLKKFDATPSTFVDDIKLTCPKIEQVNVQNLRVLRTLRVKDGKLKKIALADNMMLQYIRLINNQLTKIDVSECINLQHLYVSDNKLITLDTTKNPRLESLEASNNAIKKFNLSKILSYIV